MKMRSMPSSARGSASNTSPAARSRMATTPPPSGRGKDSSMKLDWTRLDGIRAKAHASITKLPGKAGELARKANEALGRPLADEAELADRRAFDARGDVQTPVTSS